jgi:hypothetical protein
MILGQIFGVLVTVSCVITAQLPKRWQIMLGLSAINLFSTLNQYLVGGGLTVCFPCIVAVVNCLINAVRAKRGRATPMWENLLFSVLYFGGWGAGFALSVQGGTASWMDAMPLLATAFFVLSVFVPKEQHTRFWTFCNSLVYFIFDLLHLNVAALAKLFNMTSLVIAMLRYRKRPQTEKNEI